MRSKNDFALGRLGDNRDPWSSGHSGGRIKEHAAKILQA